MKKITILLILIVLFKPNSLFSQDTIAPYLKTKVIPLFKLLKANDSLYYQKFDIPKNKQVLIILFSPDCDHCQTETNKLIEKIELFKNTHIIMASWMPYNDIKTFYKNYGLAKYKNIICGKDKAFLLPPFYKPNVIPMMALYNKKGKLKLYQTGTDALEKIIKAL